MSPTGKKLGTGNKQTDASDSHQGQSVKPHPNFQVSLRENTRGRVKPGRGEGGGGECKVENLELDDGCDLITG